jgi:hypothetical protein
VIDHCRAEPVIAEQDIPAAEDKNGFLEDFS